MPTQAKPAVQTRIAEAKRQALQYVASGLPYDDACKKVNIVRPTLDSWLDTDKAFYNLMGKALNCGLKARRKAPRNPEDYKYRPPKCPMLGTCGECTIYPCIYTPDGLTPDSAEAAGIDVALMQTLSLEFLGCGCTIGDVCAFLGLTMLSLNTWLKISPAYQDAYFVAVAAGAYAEPGAAGAKVKELLRKVKMAQ